MDDDRPWEDEKECLRSSTPFRNADFYPKSAPQFTRLPTLRRCPSHHHVLSVFDIIDQYIKLHPEHRSRIKFDAIQVSVRYISDTKANFVFTSPPSNSEGAHYEIFNAVCTYVPRLDTTEVQWIGKYNNTIETERWLAGSKIAILFDDLNLVHELIPKRRKALIETHVTSSHQVIENVLRYSCAPVQCFPVRRTSDTVGTFMYLGIMNAHDCVRIFMHRWAKKRYMDEYDD